MEKANRLAMGRINDVDVTVPWSFNSETEEGCRYGCGCGCGCSVECVLCTNRIRVWVRVRDRDRERERVNWWSCEL